ncbi:MAG: carboxymuconolactone decarboxylase family protein [Pseudomonadota bacterium]
MPRLQPLPPETTPELKAHFDFFLGTLGFTPNSVLTMQRKPKLVMAFAQLNGAVMDPAGDVDLGFRRLIGHVVSKVSGCLYCQAHTLLGARNFGVSDAKLADVWTYASSPHYSERERLALDFALAASSQPNAVTDEQFAALRVHWSEGEIVEILGVVAMFAFLNRWNDTMATPLEMQPIAVAQQALGGQGWQPGKHGSGEMPAA